MKMTLFNIGKTDVDYLRTGIEEYTKRVSHFVHFSIVDIPVIKHSKNTPTEDLMVREGNLISEAVSGSNLIVLLDERGEQLSTAGFSKWIEQKMNQGTKTIAFVTGGAYGFSQKVYDIADFRISLSKMTFTHQMVRLIFVEQLYRALTIIKGIPYHNG